MADEFFKLLGRIEVDNDALRKSMDESVRIAKEGQARINAEFEKNKPQVTPGRVPGSGSTLPAGTIFTGGRVGQASDSVFSEQGQRAAMAAKLAEAGRAAAEAKKNISDLGGAMGGAANAGRLLSGGLRLVSPSLGAMSSTITRIIPMLAALGLAVGSVVAIAGAAAIAIGVYVKGQAAALNTAIQIGVLLKNQDWSGISAGLKEASRAVATYEETVKRTVGGNFIQRYLAQTKMLWSDLTGATKEAYDKQRDFLAAEQAGYAKSGEAQRLRADSALSLLDVAKKQIELDRFLVQSDADREQISKRTIANLREETAEKLKKIAADRDDIATQLANKDISQAKADEQNAALDVRERVLNSTARQAEISETRALAKAQAEAAALRESYVQKEISRNQARVQSVADYAKSVIASERTIQDLRNQSFGIVESAATLEKRHANERAATLAPLLTGIESANALYESQKRALEALIATGADVEKNTAERAELEKAHIEDIADRRRKLAATTLQLEAQVAQAREERAQKEIAAEERVAQHRVAMGRTSMADQMSQARLAAVDPRRTLDQQRKAEEEHQSLRVEYAQNYFRLYESLGVPQYQAQLDWAKQIASEQVSGSTKWFAAVQNVANEYQKISDKAKGLFSTQAGIAEAEARRQGRSEIRPDQVGQFFQAAQNRANRKRGGASGTGLGLGDMMGILDAGGAAREDGRGPGELLTEALKRPAEELAKAIGSFSTSIGTASITSKEGNEAMANLAGSAGAAAAALDELTAAAARAAGVQGATSSSGPQAPATKGRLLPTAAGKGVWTNKPSLDAVMGEVLNESNLRAPNMTEVVQ